MSEPDIQLLKSIFVQGFSMGRHGNYQSSEDAWAEYQRASLVMQVLAVAPSPPFDTSCAEKPGVGE